MKIIRLITLLFANALVGHAQTYHSFSTDSTTWSQAVWIYSASDPDQTLQCNGSLLYGLLGDTALNGQVYSKLFRASPAVGLGSDVWEFAGAAAYAGGVREESKRVYFLEADSTDEFILYDFNLVPGDGFWFKSPLCPDSMYGVVSDTSYVQLADGSQRRKIEFASGPNVSWIEGIGSHVGWFQYEWFGTFYYAMCVSQNASTLFVYGGDCVCLPLGLNHADHELLIAPNPATNVLRLTAPPDLSDLSVYNALGQPVISVARFQESKLDIAHLPAGLYRIILKGGTSVLHGSFVKQ